MLLGQKTESARWYQLPGRGIAIDRIAVYTEGSDRKEKNVLWYQEVDK